MKPTLLQRVAAAFAPDIVLRQHKAGDTHYYTPDTLNRAVRNGWHEAKRLAGINHGLVTDDKLESVLLRLSGVGLPCYEIVMLETE